MISPSSARSCSRKNSSIGVTSMSSTPWRSRGVDDARVAGADVGAAGLGRAAELAHRMNAPADALLRFEHEHSRPTASSVSAACRPARPAPMTMTSQSVPANALSLARAQGSSTPQSAGFNGPGRPGRQQSGGAAVVARAERPERAPRRVRRQPLDDQLAHHRDVGGMSADGRRRAPWSSRARAPRPRHRRRGP